MSWPSIVIEPASGSIMRLTSRSSVDLPEPEAPTSAVMLPRSTVRETWSSAVEAP